jgi:putative glutamine amidotransferase
MYRKAINASGIEGELVLPQEFNRRVLSKLRRASGIVLCGGGDIEPVLLGLNENPHPKVSGIDKQRDILEKEATLIALERNIPILAICRGMQVLNWVLGGEIIQDIDDLFPPEGKPKYHQQADKNIHPRFPTHQVVLEKDSLIRSILKTERILVNSTHHQAVGRPGKGLVITGKALDGVAEVIEMPGKKFVLGVQFHPERMWQEERSARSIFKYFASRVKKIAI